MIFFHNPDEINGYLSNWYMSDFEYSDIKFNCLEQYMMWSKAKLFNDNQTAEKILASSDCREIKQLGREVRNFNEGVWVTNRTQIVYEGLLEKFRQNEDLRDKLLGTKDEILAECAVHDKIWGIGLSMSDTRRFNKQEWRGMNLLGACLMQVRETLQNENAI